MLKLAFIPMERYTALSNHQDQRKSAGLETALYLYSYQYITLLVKRI